MRKKKYLTGILVVFMAVAAVGATAMATEKPDESLYKRLGGYDAIATVVDDFFGRLAGDAHFARFFMGHSTQTKARIRQLTVDQLCAITGGPCVYIGRDMKTAHAGLSITEAEWEISVKHLAAALDKFKVPQKEKDELIALAATLKGDIVEKPAVKK